MSKQTIFLFLPKQGIPGVRSHVPVHSLGGGTSPQPQARAAWKARFQAPGLRNERGRLRSERGRLKGERGTGEKKKNKRLNPEGQWL